ncbi:MAG: serine protease [Pseudomonadota bacterium]
MKPAPRWPSWHFLFLALLLAWFAQPASAEDAQSLFNEYGDLIYQIRIIDQISGKQAGIGSGFVVDGNGRIVSNYHVVAEILAEPDRYRLEFVSSNGQEGPLTVLNVDVPNDLALLKMDASTPKYLSLAAALPEQGAAIYSLGNPHDLGLTVIPGTYNGIAARSANQRIHFSGSINPGMSGGPALNSSGEIIGVNVATAGNQISFLVALDKLRSFLEEPLLQDFSIEAIDRLITEQLVKSQAQTAAHLLNEQWPIEPFGEVRIPQTIAPYVRCWGQSNDDPDLLYEHSVTRCDSEERVFLRSGFDTGRLLYRFDWLKTEDLSPLQFYGALSQLIQNIRPDNAAEEEDVTPFTCHEGFAGGREQSVVKATFCARGYKRFKGLFDVLYVGMSVHEDRRALMSHFTIAGVTQENGLSFVKKFLESIQWN